MQHADLMSLVSMDSCQLKWWAWE